MRSEVLVVSYTMMFRYTGRLVIGGGCPPVENRGVVARVWGCGWSVGLWLESGGCGSTLSPWFMFIPRRVRQLCRVEGLGSFVE